MKQDLAESLLRATQSILLKSYSRGADYKVIDEAIQLFLPVIQRQIEVSKQAHQQMIDLLGMFRKKMFLGG